MHGLSGQLCSAAHPSLLQHKSPLSRITAKHHPQSPSPLFQSFPQREQCLRKPHKASPPRKTRSKDWRDCSHSKCVIYLICSLCLSPSRDEFNSLSTAQNRGQGWRTNWNSTEEKEKRAHRRKIKLIHRSFQRELRGGNSRSSFFSVSVFPPHRQRIAVGDPSLPIQELLSPPCVRMMTKAQGVKFTTVKLQLPPSTIKINLLVGKAFCKNRYCTKATLKGMFVEPKLIQGISRFSSSTTSYRFQTIISH